MRLWELEGGDGDDVGIGFAGGVEREVVILPEPEAVPQIEEVEIPPPAEIPEIVEPEVPQEALQREGPLVLRINRIPPPAPVAPPVPDPPRLQAGHRNRGPPPRDNVRHQPGVPAPGRRMLRNPNQPVQRPIGREQMVRERDAAAQEAAHQAWVQMFVQMALNDEEDQLDWDSEDEEDAEAWEIPVR
jgi:E3 ubiquitin-protein ligase RNF14